MKYKGNIKIYEDFFRITFFYIIRPYQITVKGIIGLYSQSKAFRPALACDLWKSSSRSSKESQWD